MFSEEYCALDWFRWKCHCR